MTVGGPSNLLPKTPYQLMKSGAGRKNLPMIAGAMKHDGSFSLVECMEFGVKEEKFVAYDMIERITTILGVRDETTTFTSLIMKGMFTEEQIERGLFKEMAGGFIDVRF